MDSGSESYRKFCEESDETGLVEIIRDYKDGLIFYLNSYVGNIFIAEELAEDTFVLLGTKKAEEQTNSFVQDMALHHRKERCNRLSAKELKA